MTLPIELDPEEKGNSMSKPSDIPQDVWDAARQALIDAGRNPEYEIRTLPLVVRAIMAERERCAKIADHRWHEFDAKLASGNVPEHLQERAIGRAFEAQHLADAIRKGTPMTSPLPIIVDSEDRGMKRPVEEITLAIWAGRMAYCETPVGGLDTFDKQPAGIQARTRAEAVSVLDRLVQLGFLNDNYFVAKKAEEAGDEVRKPQ